VTPDEITKLTRFLRSRFEGSPLSVRKRPQRKGLAEVFLGDDQIGIIEKDEEDGELSYSFSMDIENPPADMSKIAKRLEDIFDMSGITLKARGKKTDSAEVFIADEFVGLVYRDVEDGKPSYNFTMSILDFDLE
jgi:hypothetical protein